MSTPALEERSADNFASRTRRQLAQSTNFSTFGPLFALLIACVYFAVRNPTAFLNGTNFSLVVQQVMVIGVLAIGQTIVILTAGIDLSCGAVMAFGEIVMTKLVIDNGFDPYLAIFLGIAVCGIFGAINGSIITFLKLPPFIVTLGTLNIAYALTHIVSGERTFNNLPDVLTFFGNRFDVGGTRITYGTVLMVVLFFIAWFVLTQTARGRHVYATGNNPEAARLVGINTTALLLGVYTVAGAIYGIAALLQVGRIGSGNPQDGQTENLDAITAVVLGGTSLFGGRGNVFGSLIGALIIGIIRNGLTLTQVNSIYQYLVTGILVIAAVAVDQLARRRQR